MKSYILSLCHPGAQELTYTIYTIDCAVYKIAACARVEYGIHILY